MADFSKQNQMVCKKILENHIAINTEDHKRTIVRTMQLTGVLDDEEDSDSFLDMEEIIHTPIVNKIDTTVPLSNTKEEWQAVPSSPQVILNSFNSMKHTSSDQTCANVLNQLTSNMHQPIPRDVQIETSLDYNTDRLSYDADFYDNIKDRKSTRLNSSHRT